MDFSFLCFDVIQLYRGSYFFSLCLQEIALTIFEPLEHKFIRTMLVFPITYCLHVCVNKRTM